MAVSDEPTDTPTGGNLVAGNASADGTSTFTAVDPRRDAASGSEIHEASAQEIATAVEAASRAAATLRGWPPSAIATLLGRIADDLDANAPALVAEADRETALGTARLEEELARTTHQLRLFADVVTGGKHLDAVIDTPRKGSGPAARPDLRRCNVALGPVAVFGASNFPLAFGVPGGDTASALAAGCPVVCKGHPSHPATSEIAGRVITRAVAQVGGPGGTFSMVQGVSHAVGESLVTAPGIRAVGFTGSLSGGSALYDLAAARPDPIPVYAEMGSLNPVFVMPDALDGRGDDIAEELAASVTVGQGQFCTKPGLVFVPADDTGDRFLGALADELMERPDEPLLNRPILEALESQLDRHDTRRIAVLPRRASHGLGFSPGLLTVDAAEFVQDDLLLEEHFGPVVVAVRTPHRDMPAVAEKLPASLTAAIHAADPDDATVRRLRDVLVARVGRLVFGGYPTGVAVTAAMQHGGPYPATTAPSHTSVGTAAVRRFVRPVAFQATPDGLLPPALQDDNPLGITRTVDGADTADPVQSPEHQGSGQ